MILKFSIFKPFEDRLIHGITTKQTGSFNEESPDHKKNIKKLSAHLTNEPIISKQLHSDRIIIVSQRPAKPFEGDGFITQTIQLPLAIKIADCQALLIFDPITNTIAAVHSGWRGSSVNIIGKVIERMKEAFQVQPKNLLVGISPSLGPCCAEFTDPQKELPPFIHPYKKGKKVDFWAISLDQLKKAGVLIKNIELMPECTKCFRDQYFSHRNKDKGRMVAFISLAK